MALVGGVFALWFIGTPFSVSAAIGLSGCVGISILEGIIIVAHFNQLIDAGVDRADAVFRTGQIRMRPVMMTCSAADAGLLPAPISTGIDARVSSVTLSGGRSKILRETQRPV